jgi:hypothetical protein
MNSILQNHLIKKYHIFFDYLKKDKSDMMLPIYFGFECGDGWYNILDALMGSIKQYQEYKKIETIKINQIKEKFGTLSFYYSGGDDYIHGLVSMASSMSAITCEDCGTTDGVGVTERRWIHICCKDCFDKNDRLQDLKWIPRSNQRIIKIANLLKKYDK